MNLSRLIRNPLLYVWLIIIFGFLGIKWFTKTQYVTHSYSDHGFHISMVVPKQLVTNFTYHKDSPPSEYDEFIILTDNDSIGIHATYWKNDDPSFLEWIEKRIKYHFDQHKSLEFISRKDLVLGGSSAVLLIYDFYCRSCNPNDEQSSIKDPNQRITREYYVFLEGDSKVYQVTIDSNTWPRWKINEIIASIEVD